MFEITEFVITEFHCTYLLGYDKFLSLILMIIVLWLGFVSIRKLSMPYFLIIGELLSARVLCLCVRLSLYVCACMYVCVCKNMLRVVHYCSNKNVQLKPSCHIRFPHAFSALCCFFDVITFFP